MTLRTYKRITNTCFGVAIAAVLVLDHAGSFRWLLASLAVAAGVVAGVVHVYVQWHPVDGNALPKSRAEEHSPAPLHLLAQQSPPTWGYGIELAPAAIEGRIARETTILDGLGFVPPAFRDVLAYRHQLPCARLWFQVPSRSEPRMQVDEIVEVVRRLSASQGPPGYEFTLTPEGNLNIRPMPRRSRYEELWGARGEAEAEAEPSKPS
jgi:hypothetical protein